VKGIIAAILESNKHCNYQNQNNHQIFQLGFVVGGKVVMSKDDL
jgi:hypothetical protein